MTFPDIGVFIPLNPARTDKRSAKMGWITDERGCDIWQGSKANGYGQVSVNGRMQLVHRVRYEREIGPIPPGAELDHFICDNGLGGCCNPFHCRPTTHRENVLRGNSFASAHAAKTHCPKGHPLSGENLDKYQITLGQRKCRTCANAGKRARAASAKGSA